MKRRIKEEKEEMRVKQFPNALKKRNKQQTKTKRTN
jgi:hypothetical protein